MSKVNKKSKSVFVRVMAAVLTLMMVSSMCFTVVVALMRG